MLHRIKLAAQLQSRHRARWAHSDATIFAPATGKGKSAIAILRISGPEVLQVWHQMTRSPFTKFSHPSKELIKNEPVARKAMLRKIIHPTSKEVLDEGIVIYFPGRFNFSLRSCRS